MSYMTSMTSYFPYILRGVTRLETKLTVMKLASP